MSAKSVTFTFKKRTIAGQCRAMRCQCKEPDHELFEFETGDPKVGTALLCEEHWRRATEHAGAPASVGPAMQVTHETVGEPVTEAFGPGLEKAFAAKTEVVVEHAPVLALVEPMCAEYSGMAGRLQAMVITDQAQVDMAGTLLKQIKGKLKALKDARLEITRPMLEAKAAVDALFRPATDAAESVEGILKKGLSAFIEKQQQAKLAALEAGQHEAALAVVQPELPKGVSTRTVWRFRVVHLELVPSEYRVIDTAKVQAHVNAHKGLSSIPGIEVYCDTGIAAGSK